MNKLFSSLLILITVIFFSCIRSEEYSLEEFEAMGAKGVPELLEKTVSKPLRNKEFLPGRISGTWFSIMRDDPKSFNHLIAEQDSTTRAVVSSMQDYLLNYDYYNRKWIPNAASVRIVTNEQNNTMQVIYTLRDDLYWSYYNSSNKIKVTSDDVIFWYDEIEGEESFQSSGYYGQFLTMPNGEEERITITKIDNRSFSFNFPVIMADPELTTNMIFGPMHIYLPVKKEFDARLEAASNEEKAGILIERNNAIRNIFNVSVNPATIPSMGQWFLTEYTPGQRLVYKRNTDYWKKDSNGVSLPYPEENIVRIISEENTQLLLFLRGDIDSYSLRPEDISTVIYNDTEDYTVFNAEGALSASFWTFNQNPVNSHKPQYEWFTQKEFRQAMSCLLNRDRLNIQVYRGLAEPKLNIFPEPNPYYNPSIKNQYLFDTERALQLLYSIGFKKDIFGRMRDSKNRRVEFDLTIRSDSSLLNDTASIIRDELAKAGIKLNIRVMDFQQQVNQLFSIFDWDSMIMGLSGANIFPTQGSNVWVSSGNLHMWYPYQESPATKWEARIDALYNEGKFTINPVRAQEIWDEFQSILMDELPMIHLMRSRSFWALNNRWDLSNVYFDNMNGAETEYIYIRQ
ncbi:MAG: ABC transporter substrate-binding protein [Treponema sp.]|jgi:peptide/nickel transport system substrate-binding protein|nr:ABC transporter substrate-binding protein [Treponema sp.]